MSTDRGLSRTIGPGRLEIVVEKDGDFEAWLATLENEIGRATA